MMQITWSRITVELLVLLTYLYVVNYQYVNIGLNSGSELCFSLLFDDLLCMKK